MRKYITLILFLMSMSVFAQNNNLTSPPINSHNFQDLQSVDLINFEDLDAEFDTGWFQMSSDGSIYEGITSDKRRHLFPSSFWGTAMMDGKIIYGKEEFVSHRNVINLAVDAAFGNIFTAIAYQTDDEYFLRYELGSFDAGDIRILNIPSAPTNIWADCINNAGYLWCSIWLEMLDTDGKPYILEIPSLLDDSSQKPIEHPYAPAQDEDAIVRIGRIPPPYVVTSSIDGIVKLWNLETGETVYEVDNGTGEAAVFGNINADATHLVWRDHGSNALYLLNFETGENRFIDDLNGAYVQWFFLSNDASLIIAVNYNFEPNIVVWDVETGERTVLGEYRDCERPQPDMARLSADGTTLVIGCDTGLDIWRVVED